MKSSWPEFDRQHVWHPYSSLTNPLPALPVVSASGVRIELQDGRQLIDGMASWWSVIHGYRHPTISKAAVDQLETLPHVMFGGLNHEPAAELCAKLIEITPHGLNNVFLSDSGSVSVDVAMKMALQYWRETGRPAKQKFVSLRGGYHGDTLGSMSLCDPTTGMHHLFGDVLAKQFFVPRPLCRFGEQCEPEHIVELQCLLESRADEIAALVMEPIVQGAGGMYFYSADYLATVRRLCDEHNVLLIADEIATGFGRTGVMFACEHADVAPDIMCVGKAMTGGYLSLAATLSTDRVAEGICNGEAGAFMHGPTFMGNPLACRIASTSIQLLLDNNFRSNVGRIQAALETHLLPLNDHRKVREARVLGAIGVLETHEPVDMRAVQRLLPELGVWLRPFGRLTYTMPPYITTDEELATICDAMTQVIERCTPTRR